MMLWVAPNAPAPTCKQPSTLNSVPGRPSKQLPLVQQRWSCGSRAPLRFLLSGCQVSRNSTGSLQSFSNKTKQNNFISLTAPLASLQIKAVLNTELITTDLSLHSALAWMQSREEARCSPAPVTGHRHTYRLAVLPPDICLTPHRVCAFSEAILALQLEVSKLKKDLQEGLVQLPHLAQKMDYLTSKYREDREERKSTARTRKHHRSALNRWEQIYCKPSWHHNS